MLLLPVTSAIDAADQVAVPVAVPDVELAALAHVTEVTPTLSEAVPDKVRTFELVEYVALVVGAVMAAEGACVSAAAA
jgi:hypothetical protein